MFFLRPLTSRPSLALNRYFRAVELRHRKAAEGFVVAGLLILQDSNGHFLAQLQRFSSIRTPVNTGRVATKSNIRRNLVQFAADGEIACIATCVRHQGSAII